MPTNPTATPCCPSRYIRIICEGLEHFGADPAWIAHIKQQPFNPARPRSEWMIIPEAPEGAALPLFTLSELEQHKGRLPAVYAIGRKVVRAEVEEGHPFAPIMKLISGNQVGGGHGGAPAMEHSMGPLWVVSSLRAPLGRLWHCRAVTMAISQGVRKIFI